MQEVVFLKQNMKDWKAFEKLLDERSKVNPDSLADLFVRLTDDLSYARTNYPGSKIVSYLNDLAAKAHQKLYRNKKERRGRFVQFWKYELPEVYFSARKEIIISFTIFIISICIGLVSAANDVKFIRMILGDSYVNLTLDNIEKGDPLAIYKEMQQVPMFLGITMNNIYVSFLAFIFGIFFSVGTGYLLFTNGIMLGSFQYLFYENGLLVKSLLVIWIHGTLEISAIIIAGAAGLTMGNGFLFPGTYPRLTSFQRNAKRGLKMVVGLVPVFIIAGFLESFVTRYTEMPVWFSLLIIGSSLSFIVWYFFLYPVKLQRR
ncbi:MAG: stage II sporulation protein M [Calditrichaceae bacterium]|nr:stage II sporulation protein M [Calditrichaceae bacterium]MBN2708692.1 stage II sporulation protein M [Calditrichaceae bacterium]RQV92805.1 MAG: stage II sporulation protein M [Calditrichota bacterium]